jgi:DNA-binding beta-propeller fold protein YncE
MAEIPTPRPTPEPTLVPSPTPVPTPSTASTTQIGGLPAGLDVNASDGRVFIADASGVIWTTNQQKPTLRRPFNLDRLPVDLGVDQTTGNVYVSARSAPAILVLDATSGRRLATIALPVSPGDLVVDSDLGLLYVVLPERQALGVVDVRGGRLFKTLDGQPQITGLALDPARHVLFATHLAGQLSIIDVASSQVVGRVSLTGAGLASVATARGLVYAVNTATHELAVVEPIGQNVIRYALTFEPAAVVAGEDSGSVYVLASRPNTIVRIDPMDGTELGRVLLPDRSGRFGVTPANQRDFQGLRSRMVLSSTDETLYVTLPEAGTLSVVPTDQFPPLAREIPRPDVADRSTAESIPGVLRPAAAPLPSRPAPIVRAQAPDPQPDTTTTDQEGS